MSGIPPLYGLVMAGGLSERMGQDKGGLRYRDVSQRQLLAGLLAGLCERVYVSCRPDQRATVEPGLECLVDRVPDIGPLGGLDAAFGNHADVAWLVVACDVPLLSYEALERLVKARDPLSDLTAYRSPVDGLVEPLIAIWEPSMAPKIVKATRQGQRGLRRLCDRARVRLIDPASPDELLNVNTPEEFAAAQRKLTVPRPSNEDA